MDFPFYVDIYIIFFFSHMELLNIFLQEQHDPFSLVADELSILANRLRSMVVAEVCNFLSSCCYHFLLTE